MLAKIMQWTSIVVLLAAVLWSPSAGYTLLVQFVVCAAAVMAVVQSLQGGKIGVAIVFVVVAALFNPVVPVGPSRAMFVGIAWVSLALFLLSVLTFRQQPRLSIASITDRTPGSESL